MAGVESQVSRAAVQEQVSRWLVALPSGRVCAAGRLNLEVSNAISTRHGAALLQGLRGSQATCGGMLIFRFASDRKLFPFP